MNYVVELFDFQARAAAANGLSEIRIPVPADAGGWTGTKTSLLAAAPFQVGDEIEAVEEVIPSKPDPGAIVIYAADRTAVLIADAVVPWPWQDYGPHSSRGGFSRFFFRVVGVDLARIHETSPADCWACGIRVVGYPEVNILSEGHYMRCFFNHIQKAFPGSRERNDLVWVFKLSKTSSA